MAALHNDLMLQARHLSASQAEQNIRLGAYIRNGTTYWTGNATLSQSLQGIVTKLDIVIGTSGAATTAALAAKAPIASPTFTGNPLAPTPSDNDSSTSIATTAFVMREVSDLINSAPGALNTLKELADSLNDDTDFAGTMTTNLATKATVVEVNKIEAAIGPGIDASGDYVALTGSNYVGGNTNLTNDIIKLDAAVKQRYDDHVTQQTRTQASASNLATAYQAADTTIKGTGYASGTLKSLQDRQNDVYTRLHGNFRARLTGSTYYIDFGTGDNVPYISLTRNGNFVDFIVSHNGS